MLAEIETEGGQGYRQIIRAGQHQFFADLSADKGGKGAAPDPHQLFYAAWGACTNMTLQLYCQRKNWPLESVKTTFAEERRAGQTWVTKRIELTGPLDEAQQARLQQIAEKCPVNQLITGPTQIIREWVFQA
ncbi:OsmC family protein [Vampirovibrio chlorellavorus]|uniref:OsmC family protein n=1 Tax=Vampirovibrio chlorellavorus TaxID=758823 RepID=UPI0026E9BBF6|nr:OsmC family protein [Vampirovibrio chlorellavorus]